MKVLHSAFDQILKNTDKIDEDHDAEKIPLQLLQCIEILYDNVPLTEDDQMMVSVFTLFTFNAGCLKYVVR